MGVPVIFVFTGTSGSGRKSIAHRVGHHIVEQYLDHYTDEVMYRRNCEHVFENIELNKTLDMIRSVVLQYR